MFLKLAILGCLVRPILSDGYDWAFNVYDDSECADWNQVISGWGDTDCLSIKDYTANVTKSALKLVDQKRCVVSLYNNPGCLANQFAGSLRAGK